ncbi:MAG: hypothetical protein AAF690_29705, partial [Acidobacteriota bacterium]
RAGERVTDALLEAIDETAALERLHELGCTDGLPVVVPTPERVERMVTASGMDAVLELGSMGPAGGAATVEKICAAAVMAGCLPEHLPVVLAAVQAVMDPAFDLAEMQSTTHCTAPLILLNGPARRDCGDFASGFGALGPGFRANASVGRALRLAMINIGGGRPGESDMALLGHPGKFTYLLAEAEESSPWEPLHVSRGFAADESAVTVVGAEPPRSVIYQSNAGPEGAAELVGQLAGALCHSSTNNGVIRGGTVVVALNPEHAQMLANADWSRRRVQEELFARCLARRSNWRFLRPELEFSPDDDPLEPCFESPEQLLVLVAGGPGLYSAVMTSWCAGAHRNSAVSQGIEYGEVCELPFARSR